MKKISLTLFCIMSLSVISESAPSQIEKLTDKYAAELPQKLVMYKELPSYLQRTYQVEIGGKTYIDFGFKYGEKKFLVNPDQPDRLAYFVMTDSDLGKSRRKPDPKSPEDFSSFDAWKAAQASAGATQKDSPSKEFYDRYDRQERTITFYGETYTEKTLGSAGISKIGAMIETSNKEREGFEKGGLDARYNHGVIMALGEMNKALNRRNLSAKDEAVIAKKMIELEASLRSRHQTHMAISRAIREQANIVADEAPLLYAQREANARLHAENVAYERARNIEAHKYEAARNDSYTFNGNDLRAPINRAIDGIKNAKGFSFANNYQAVLTREASSRILTFPVKNADRLPDRPANYRPGSGYSAESLSDFDQALQDRQLKSFLNLDRLSTNLGTLDLSAVPTVTLSSGGKIVDVGYVMEISEKIRNRSPISQNEKDLMTAILMNFSDPADFERLFSLIYSYEIRLKSEINLQRSVLEYSKTLSTDMLRLLLISKLNTHGLSRRNSYESLADDKAQLVKNYEQIENASRAELEKLLARDGTSYLRDIPSKIIIPLVFLKLVDESNDTYLKNFLKMPSNFSKANARDVGEYVHRLNYIVTLDQQRYMAHNEKFGNTRGFSDWHDIYLPDVTSRVMKTFEVFFPYPISADVRIKSSAISRLNLPEYFKEILKYSRGGLDQGSEHTDKAQAKFMLKNSKRTFDSSSSSSTNSCMRFYQ